MSKKKIEDKIRNIKQQLVVKYKPEKIILFGSYVWGKFGPDSDLDFLIIKEDVPFYGHQRMYEVRKLIRQKGIACDFLVGKPTEIKKRLYLEDPFVKEIMTKGRVIYG